MEWELFDQVQNIGGRAVCQDNWSTFQIMRSSQLLPWPPELLSSYRDDLLEAKAAGRNPLSEKYGYMMERTCPEEYQKIRRLLPQPGEAKTPPGRIDLSNSSRLAGGDRRPLALPGTPWKSHSCPGGRSPCDLL